MCGISAVVGEQDVVTTLFESIRNLEYRGYDSCGLAVIEDSRLEVRKNTGGVDEVNKKEHLTSLRGQRGIAHTRWATHGRVTQQNAHPHLSQDGRFAIVHNGIINNYLELKTELTDKGVVFQSETDTEVLAHLLGLAYAEFGDVTQAFLAALSRVDGTYAVAMVTPLAPDKVFCVRHGSPLVLGLDAGRNFAASDVNAFLPYTKRAVFLEDGDYAIISPQGHEVRQVATGQIVDRQAIEIHWDAETSRKGGYSHFMLKEIFDQPTTLGHALDIPLPDIQALAQAVQKANRVFLLGVGTTYYVGLLGQYLFTQLAGHPVQVASSDEFSEMAVLMPGDLVIAISQSGETYDTRMAVQYARDHGARTAAIVNVMGCTLGRLADQVIMQGSGPEICVVSTKAALAQMIILLRVALELGRMNGTQDAAAYAASYEALRDFPPALANTLNEISGFVRNLADQTIHYQNWLFLGRGIFFPVAMEAALKMKEVTYLHVEGIPAGFLKHGTLAMVDDKLASLFFVPPISQSALHQQTMAAIEEVKARGGPVIGFVVNGDQDAKSVLDHYVELPPLHPLLAPFMELIVGQLFSYFAALRLGRAIDKPRNLAKSVTVG